MRSLILCLCFIFICFGCKKKKQNDPAPEPEPQKELFPPSVTTHPAQVISPYAIHVTGTVTDTGSFYIEEAGFVLDTVPMPSIEKRLWLLKKTLNEENRFDTSLAGLESSKTYYIRAYAKNKQGLAYGDQESCTTLRETVYRGDVVLKTQYAVNAFGAKKYIKVDGSMYITGTTVTDLRPLETITSITKELQIYSAPQLTNLNGLENLDSINILRTENCISLHKNDALISIEGLSGLTDCYGALTLNALPSLINLQGLHNIKSIRGPQLSITGCTKIKDLTGLEGLEHLEVGGLSFSLNDQLQSIEVLRHLQYLSFEAFGAVGNAMLPTLAGLEKSTGLKFLLLAQNPALRDIRGLVNMDSIYTLQLNDLPQLTSLPDFNHITQMDQLHIENCALTGIPFPNLRIIGYKLTIIRTEITDFTGLDKLEHVSELEIRNNELLETFKGMNNLQKVTSPSRVCCNPKLKSIDGLRNLRDMGYSFYITNHPLLIDFCPLKTLFSNWNGFWYCNDNGANPRPEDIRTNCP